MKHSNLSRAVSLFLVGSLTLFLALATHASADDECRSDQRQMQNAGAVPFGARTVLAQTFIPAVPGQRICRVKVSIRKNVAGAGNITLRLVRSNFTPLDAAVTIPGGPIPLGSSVQLFDFGCDGAALAGVPFYGLRLESPDSVMGAYSWQGIGNNPYVKPGNGGRGWRNLNAGTGPWTSLEGWDYAFEIYMCA